jgi:hypothetical protein
MREQNAARDENDGRTIDADRATKNAEQTEELESHSCERLRVHRPVGRGWSAWGTTLVT